MMPDKSKKTLGPKVYRLLAADGTIQESDKPGALGGSSETRIYGQLDCTSAVRALPKGYAKQRVFFVDEAAAIAAGYRPCGICMRDRYKLWKKGGVPGAKDYPWTTPPESIKR